MKLRKLPLFIHVDPLESVVLNKTCRYCPDCDLLIAHQDQIEALLLQMFPAYTPETIHEHYSIIGTVERKVWREGLTMPLPLAKGLRYLHDFKEVHTIYLRPAGWYPEETKD
jgi:hypothetical protein